MKKNIELIFNRTCRAYPEQYDVYIGERYIAYVRLRSGRLTVCPIGKDNEPEFDNYTIVKDWKNDPLKGSFDSEEERQEYIGKIKEIILNGQLRKQEQPND